MKKIFPVVRGTLFTIGFVLALTACEFETSGNGDLDGLWQLTRQDSVGTSVTTDMRSSGVYWAVQVRLLQIQGGPQRGYYRFTLGGGWLTLRSADLDREGHEDPTVLYRYRVKTLDGSRMVLEDEKMRLDFRKY